MDGSHGLVRTDIYILIQVFNNWYVRSLNGPETYKLPLGAVNSTHLRRAQKVGLINNNHNHNHNNKEISK